MPSNTPLPAAELLRLADAMADHFALVCRKRFPCDTMPSTIEAYRAARAASPRTLEEALLDSHRAGKLLRKGAQFIVIRDDEPYYASVYSTIRDHQIDKGCWDDVDEQQWADAMGDPDMADLPGNRKRPEHARRLAGEGGAVVKESLTAQPDPTPDTCRWTQDEFKNWFSGCSGVMPTVTPWDGKAIHGMFCPECGKRITTQVHDKP